jgi:hypothetical protein
MTLLAFNIIVPLQYRHIVMPVTPAVAVLPAVAVILAHAGIQIPACAGMTILQGHDGNGCGHAGDGCGYGENGENGRNGG